MEKEFSKYLQCLEMKYLFVDLTRQIQSIWNVLYLKNTNDIDLKLYLFLLYTLIKRNIFQSNSSRKWCFGMQLKVKIDVEKQNSRIWMKLYCELRKLNLHQLYGRYFFLRFHFVLSVRTCYSMINSWYSAPKSDWTYLILWPNCLSINTWNFLKIWVIFYFLCPFLFRLLTWATQDWDEHTTLRLSADGICTVVDLNIIWKMFQLLFNIGLRSVVFKFNVFQCTFKISI